VAQNIISAEVVDPRTGRPTNATIAFSLSYDNESPAMAQKVANDLTSLYLKENIKSRKQKASETSIFLTEEAEKLEKTISLLEEELARFKQENSGKLPELVDMNLSLMNRTDTQIDEVESQLRNLQERKIYLDSELAQLNPHSTLFSSSGQRVLSPEDRLKMLQTKYLSDSSKYAEDHPDLIRMRKEIEKLQSEIGWVDEAENLAKQHETIQANLTDLSGRYSENHPDIKKARRELESVNSQLEAIREKQQQKAQVKSGFAKPDNPAYVQLKAQLEAALVEMKSLKQKRERLTEKYQEYEQRIIEMPIVEKDYRALLRNYEQAVVKHRDIKARLMEAKLGQSLEEGRKGERFELIEPPMLPEKPLKPNRKAILALGFFLSIGAALGMAVGLDQIDSRVWGYAGIKSITGSTPIVAIPYIETSADRRRKWVIRLGTLLILIAIIVMALFTVHLFYKPLDVLWYIVMRKAELMFI
ncbi:MAG: lipopolysaccharide biosynthesis protein, partial [Gammaproteobacteria bacterium]